MAKLCAPIIVNGRKLSLFDRFCLWVYDTHREQEKRNADL